MGGGAEGAGLCRRDGSGGGARVVIPRGGKVLVVGVGFVVDIPWVHGAVRKPPDAVLSPTLSPSTLHAPVDGRSFGVNSRHGKRDRGKCVE